MSVTGFCPNCFTGTLRGDAILTGREEEIHGVSTYVARPEPGVEPKAIVVIIPDAFGWKLLNSRALADNYAKRAQVLVYLPEFMNGAAQKMSMLSSADSFLAPSSSWTTTVFMKPWWVLKFVIGFIPFIIWCRESVVKPRITKFFQDLRSNPPPFATEYLKVGVAGFCWGGYYAIYLSRDEAETRVPLAGSYETSPLVDCVFVAHPSLVSVPGDIEGIKLPISIANGPDDAMMGREKLAIVSSILEGKGDIAHEVVPYEGATHGFAVRGSPNDPTQAEYGLLAEDQAVNWFKKHLH